MRELACSAYRRVWERQRASNSFRNSGCLQCARRMEPGRSQRSLLGPLFVLLSELGTRCLRALEQPILSRAANIIMEQAPVAESLRLPLATQGGEPWALKKTPHALALESHGSEIAVIIRDFLARVT